jgi:hypothetical protein
MKRLVLAAAIVTALVTSAVAASQEYLERFAAAKKVNTDAEMADWEANNQGYATGALKVCGDWLVLTDKGLFESLNKKYRDNPRYQKEYLDGLTATIGRDAAWKKMVTCMGAVSAVPWLELTPGATEAMEADMEREKKQRGH